MIFQSGNTIADTAEGVISAKKQVGTHWLDLTVKAIASIRRGGALDFGGSEYEEASTKDIVAVKESSDEKYGWWTLKEGTYCLRFNEVVTDDVAMVCVFPHPRLIAAGGAHPATVVEKLDEYFVQTLWVGSGGLRIKENARISRALVYGAND